MVGVGPKLAKELLGDPICKDLRCVDGTQLPPAPLFAKSYKTLSLSEEDFDRLRERRPTGSVWPPGRSFQDRFLEIQRCLDGRVSRPRRRPRRVDSYRDTPW